MKTSHGLVMDGFMKGGSGSSGNSSSKVQKITEASNLLDAKAASSKLKSAAQGVHVRAQRSQTLMRTVVKKPAIAAKTTLQSYKPDITKPRASHVDSSRLARVESIDKNTKVRRFGHGVSAPRTAEVPKVEVGEVMPKRAGASAGKEIVKPLPSMVTSVSHQHLERMLDEALNQADAHKKLKHGRLPNQSLVQKVKNAPRWLTIGGTLIVLACLVVYIALNRVPSIAMRVASTKSHVNAKMPAYVPSGFAFVGPVDYNNGSVSVKFHSNDGSGREFTLKQASSNMNSQSLEDKVVPDNTQVQTSVVNGTTVYIYGQSNDAAWVNNGIQYTVKDGANLNSDQLLKIASSL
jgi:hypothetical protein